MGDQTVTLRPRRTGRVARPPHAGLLVGVAAALILSSCRPEGPDEGPPTGPTPPGAVSVTLEWDPPVTDATGDPLDDLAGYRLYYGTSTPLSTSGDTFIDVGLATSYTLEDLAPGTYYFATTAIDESGNESVLSAELRADLQP